VHRAIDWHHCEDEDWELYDDYYDYCDAVELTMEKEK
jgi:hypothetical protein